MTDRERSRSSADVDRFDRLMADLDPPVTIVTTQAGDERGGCLVGFQSQCSIEPRKYALWLSKANHTYRLALRSGVLAVHLLGPDDRDLAELFGGRSGDDIDKFAGIEVDEGPGGVPLLARCPRRLVLHRTALLDEGGDHVCVVAELAAAHGAPGGPPLRVSDVDDIVPGHEAEERPHPPGERHT